MTSQLSAKYQFCTIHTEDTSHDSGPFVHRIRESPSFIPACHRHQKEGTNATATGFSVSSERHSLTLRYTISSVESQVFTTNNSSVLVLSRTGHFEYSPVHNSVNINGRYFILHLHGSCHMCVSMCDQQLFVNYFNWPIYP